MQIEAKQCKMDGTILGFLARGRRGLSLVMAPGSRDIEGGMGRAEMAIVATVAFVWRPSGAVRKVGQVFPLVATRAILGELCWTPLLAHLSLQ